MFMYSLDGTIVADLIPSIVNEFDSVPLLPWLSVGFMVGSIVTVLPLGKLFSKYNAKWLYVISVVLFLTSSALCGAAPTMSAMIVGRVFLGMSGNGIYFGIMTLLSVYTDDKERPMYLSLVGLVWGVGTVLGPVVGGVSYAEGTNTMTSAGVLSQSVRMACTAFIETPFGRRLADLATITWQSHGVPARPLL